MAYPQSITFQGIPVVGLDGTIRRGTTPGVFRIRVPHDAALKLDAGDLVFSSDGGTITFGSCVPDLSTLRLENRGGRREYSLLVYDRRKAWVGETSTGRYNRRYRDNTIEAATKKAAGDIGDLILAVLGEVPASTGALGDIYPECDWSETPCNEAIAQLLATVPGHLCRTKTDKYEFRKTEDGDGIDAGLPAKNPDYLANIDSGPKTVQVVCNKTWFGCALELEAVGLDTDGTWKLLDSLSYAPSSWATEWPTLFSGVTPAARSWLAFPTIYRCYRVKVPQALPFLDSGGNTIYLYDRDDIDLDPYRLMSGEVDPAPAYVNGEFWPYSDHPYNTDDCPVVACDFEIDNVNKLVRFAQPIFKMGSCIAAADLELHTSFHLRDNATGGWYRDTYSDDREDGYGVWSLDVPYLWRAMSATYTHCARTGSTDNKTALDTEANALVAAWKAHWDAVRNKRCVAMAGLHPVSLSGKIAQLDYRLGRGLTPQTRVAVHYEPRR